MRDAMKMSSRKIPGVDFPTGAHRWYECDEPFVECTYEGHPCGCRIVGSGTLRSPLDIRYCATHGAAPRLPEAARTALASVETKNNVTRPDLFRKTSATAEKLRSAISEAEGGGA